MLTGVVSNVCSLQPDLWRNSRPHCKPSNGRVFEPDRRGHRCVPIQDRRAGEHNHLALLWHLPDEIQLELLHFLTRGFDIRFCSELGLLCYHIFDSRLIVWIGWQVRDGSSPDAPLLANVCGYRLPASIHSSGNHLWLKSRRTRDALWSRIFRYDLTYTTTDRGSGCGGAVFNTRGAVTSWGFPGNSSRASDCRWEITVPLGLLIKVEFTCQ